MRVCVFVFRQVSAHMHEYAPSSYVYWSSCDTLLLFFFSDVCLFVCFRHIYYCYFIPSRLQQGSTPLTSISCHADNITCIECEYTFSRELVNVNANTNQQTKTKEHNMDLSLSQSHYSLLCLPSLLAGVAIRSYNGRISLLPQEPSEAFCLWLKKYIFVRASLFIPFIHTLIFLTFQTQVFLIFLWMTMIQTALKMKILCQLRQKKIHLGIVIALCAWLVLPPLRWEEKGQPLSPHHHHPRLPPCLFIAKWKQFNP